MSIVSARDFIFVMHVNKVINTHLILIYILLLDYGWNDHNSCGFSGEGRPDGRAEELCERDH